MPLSRATCRLQAGFSLITASVILTVAALIFVSMLPGQEAGDYNSKDTINIKKLERVDEAMRSFMAQNGRRPCPADGSSINTANFGVEASTPGTCAGAPLGPDAGTGYVVGGTIPTKPLGLSDDYAIDAYGHRFGYVVDIRATGNSSCLSTTTGGITIKSSTSGTTLDNTMYAYISYGASGYGAYPENGAPTPANRINSGSTDGDMQTNAGVDAHFAGASNFTYSTANWTHVLVQKPRVASTFPNGGNDTGFDDLVWFRNDLKNTCALGLLASTAGSCSTSGLAAGFLPASMTNGQSIPTTYVSQSNCTAHTLACTSGTLTCDGSGTLTNCMYSSCTPGCTETVNQGGGTLNGAGPGNTAVEYASNSGSTCVANTMTCTSGTLSCSTGNMSDCQYSSCTAIPPGCSTTGLASFNPPSMTSSQSLPAYTLASDATCTANTLTCNNGSLSCSTGNMTNCQYSSCALTCALSANQGGGTLTSGNTRNPEYASTTVVQPATCTANTLTCTNGSLSCSTGTIGDCQYSSCAQAFDEKINGKTPPSYTGRSIAIGDINDDGYADLVIGAYGASPNGISNAGAVYVLLGSATGLPTSLALNGANGFELDGVSANDGAGWSVALGDVNGDGYADIIIGAEGTIGLGGANNYAGYTYVVFGNADGSHVVKKKDGTAWSAAQKLAMGTGNLINGTNGVRFDGTNASDYSGSALAVGDINGDGKKDLIIGAYNASPNGVSHAGSTYLVYNASPLLPVTTASTTSGSTCATVASATNIIAGENISSANTPAGTTVSAINAACNNGGGSCAGATCATLSAAATATAAGTPMSVASVILNTSYINATNGIRFDGVNVNDYSGSALAAGDIDGVTNGANKVDDIIIGTFGGNSSAGYTYIVYGHADSGAVHENKSGAAWSSTQTLSTIVTAAGQPAIQLNGVTANDQLGISAAAGDVNGDGYPDILIGAHNANSGAGYTYAVFGGADVAGVPKMKNGTAWTGSGGNSLAPSNATTGVINGLNGVRFDGQTIGDFAGGAVAAGDFNGDGIKDIIIGAHSASYGASTSGSTYIVFGKSLLLPQTTITTVHNSTAATVGSFSGLYVGQGISSADVQAGTRIAACGGGPACTSTNITLSVKATAAGSNLAMQIATTPLNTTYINATNGFRLDDNTASEQAGGALAAGDFNGAMNSGYDLDDIAIGATTANGGTGAVFILNGETSGWSATNTLQ